MAAFCWSVVLFLLLFGIYSCGLPTEPQMPTPPAIPAYGEWHEYCTVPEKVRAAPGTVWGFDLTLLAQTGNDCFIFYVEER